ncbi:site-specific DNA-methyltransferase [Dysgonomonas reticulitermitis]
MATGITKNNWQEEVHIISSEIYEKGVNYQISYEGKTSIEKLINSLPIQKYETLIEENNNNQLYYGDNLDVMKHLVHNQEFTGKIKLVYIDPPYGTNSIFQTRHQKNSYKDDLIGSHYIEFIRRRLILLKELMSNSGSIYVHLDNNMVFQIKMIMDEVFGTKNFRGLITRKKCSNKNYTKKTYGNISDYILFYSKTDDYIWHRPAEAWTDEKVLKEYPCIDEATGRRYKKVPIHAPGIRNGETGSEWRGMLPPKGKHWQYTPSKLDELDEKGEIYWSANGNPRRKVFFEEDKGIPIQDIWLDVQDSLNQNIKTTGYPTEKNPDLLKRIIKASSNEGDLVLDCFAGSGTTLEAAQSLNRKWIGIDNSSEAIASVFKRFFNGLENMGSFVKKTNKKKNEAKNQQSLFPSLQVEKNDTNETLEKFNFIIDSFHKEEIEEEIRQYLQDL